jgi:hypothetical protein
VKPGVAAPGGGPTAFKSEMNPVAVEMGVP